MYIVIQGRGVARIFQREGRGVTVCQSEGTHQIVMSFLPPVVGCLLKKSSQNGGGGVTSTPGPPSGYTPDPREPSHKVGKTLFLGLKSARLTGVQF